MSREHPEDGPYYDFLSLHEMTASELHTLLYYHKKYREEGLISPYSMRNIKGQIQINKTFLDLMTNDLQKNIENIYFLRKLSNK